MYGRIVKSERIVTKLRVLDYEYICDRIAKFHKKILFITRVINIQILTTNISVSNIALHTAVSQRSCPQSTWDHGRQSVRDRGTRRPKVCVGGTPVALSPQSWVMIPATSLFPTLDICVNPRIAKEGVVSTPSTIVYKISRNFFEFFWCAFR